MNSAYIKALEKKAQWLHWFQTKPSFIPESGDNGHINIVYRKCLEEGETFFMNAAFCDLVDHARVKIPADTKFELSWPPTQKGWMWLETPFSCPKWVLDERARQLYVPGIPEKDLQEMRIKIAAVGWLPATRVKDLEDTRRWGAIANPVDQIDGYMFMCFVDLGDHFEKWSYFTFMENDEVSVKTKRFEATAEKFGGNYDPTTIVLHEIPWIYTAMHLMSQKLSIHIEHETDRATRRRAEREKKVVSPTFRVITLRKMEAAREKHIAEGGSHIDWQWHWAVRGHWRNQWCPSIKAHRHVFVESYIKGDLSKPMKPDTQKIFVAKR